MEKKCLLLMLDMYQNPVRCLYVLFSETTGQNKHCTDILVISQSFYFKQVILPGK